MNGSIPSDVHPDDNVTLTSRDTLLLVSFIFSCIDTCAGKYRWQRGSLTRPESARAMVIFNVIQHLFHAPVFLKGILREMSRSHRLKRM